MNPALIPLIGSFFSKTMDVVKEVVPDKDKQAEIALKLSENQLQFQQMLIQQSTVPWVDAIVKLLYALSDLIKQHWRPVLSGFAFVWGLFNPELLKQLQELGTAGELGVGAIFGSLPGWMWSRHTEKKRNGK